MLKLAPSPKLIKMLRKIKKEKIGKFCIGKTEVLAVTTELLIRESEKIGYRFYKYKKDAEPKE